MKPPKDPTKHLALLWAIPLEDVMKKKPTAKPKPGKPPRKPRY